MAKEIDWKQTKRAAAYEMWKDAPMPMVTLFKKLDVTNLLKLSSKRGYKFNMLMCYSIGKAASETEEFYLLPVGGKMMKYDSLAVNAVVETEGGGINTCDIPFSDDLIQFNRDYLKLTESVRRTCAAYNLGEDYTVIGTSAITNCEIDGAVNIYAGIYNNPFMIWGRYAKKFRKTTLIVSFQFHHAQMDGAEAAGFLLRLQDVIKRLKV